MKKFHFSFLLGLLFFSLQSQVFAQGSPVDGGTITALSETDLCFQPGDTIPVNLSVENASGENFIWLLIDAGVIIRFSEEPVFDFFVRGRCDIYHLAYNDIQNLRKFAKLSELEGDFDLSNQIVVTRTVVDGGELTGGPFEFIIDGEADNVSGIELTGNEGPNFAWIVTDDQGNILGLPPTPEVVDFDGAGPGTCFIYHIAFADGLTGLEGGSNINSDLAGCFDLSNGIEVVRLPQVDGGMLTGGPFEFCIDGEEDNVSGIELTDNVGSNSAWIVTDDQGNILGLPPTPEVVDFDGAGPGVCFIYHISFEDGLEGLEGGNNINTDFDGVYDLSNGISVTRILTDGGELTGGPFEFIIDGEADNVSGIELTGNEGPNFAWIVTDDQGNILGLPPTPEVVDFDGAGPGTCFIYHIAFADGLTGLEGGSNINTDLAGCFDLSNGIEVVRLPQVDGGMLTGGPFEFCIDGEEDNVSGIELTDNVGSNSAWIVTDDQGNILGLPPTPEVVDFDGAGPGVCFIYHISFEDGLVGLEGGNNINTDFDGVYDLSNGISVTRILTDGGELTGGPFEFIIDGEADNVSGIELTGNEGPNFAWIVTDDQGNILGLPPTPEVVDFDGAGPGTCFIYHIAFADGLTGLEGGSNINSDLAGCFDLSNGIEVVRLPQVDGGMLTGGPFEFCIDGEEDNVSGIELTDNVGSNSAWIVTDDQGNILGLPPTPEVVDFDGAGPGVCFIYHISFEDGLEGLEGGNNINTDFDGVYDLSNGISVTRILTDGGELTGGPFEFIIDGEADNVSGIELTGNEGPNFAWIVTDDQGNILGLPPTPEVVDFDGAGPGTCFIYHIAFADGLTGLEGGSNINTDLAGCFDLSNGIEVVRLPQVDGGMLTGGPFEFCIDGEEDNVSGIELTDNVGSNSAWIVTDDQGNILGLPPTPEVVDFDGAGPGVCFIYHISFEDGLEGLEGGNNINTDFDGVYDLSNGISVTRILTDGGELTGGPFEFIIDGEADNVSGIELTGNEGPNFAWIVTDDQGNILGLPPTPEVVDFDGAGPGTCFIYHIAFADGLTGLEGGSNINSDLAGCFDLSNGIEVVRLPQVDGGMLTGGPFEFCIDGEEDNVSGIELTDNVGSNSAWIVTDDQGNILGLPPTPEVVDFDGAGPGVCFIYHISFEDGLVGLEGGNNINTDFDGVYDLSNGISVTRILTDGGELTGGPFEFIIDGEADNVSGIELTGNEGPNFAWIVTDDQGNILGLPPTPEVVDFDGAGPGTCFIYHIAFADGLTGLEGGSNINTDLAGCFDLSNGIEVVRLPQVDGGMLTGGPFEFCIDGEEDNVSGIELTDNVGSNSAWIVTDDQGNILGLPPTPEVVDFDGAGPGVCFIYHISFEDGLVGLEGGNNINTDFDGVYDLSNGISVTRILTDGGELTGGPFEFIIDGEADNVSGIELTGNEGPNFAWIVTDDQGNILGLPPTPEVVDFDGAGPGTCFIYHIAFADGLTGLEGGSNINSDLAGCFDLSNGIEVVRIEPATGSAPVEIFPNPTVDKIAIQIKYRFKPGNYYY